MKAFVSDVLRRFGGEVREAPGGADGFDGLEVSLPAEGEGDALARRLGRHALTLVFDAADVGPGRELVTPGSHLLRQLDGFLAERGRRAYVERPAEHRLTLKRVREAVRPGAGAKLALEDRAAAAGFDLYLVYALRFRSLDREDALETVRVVTRPGRPAFAELAEPAPEVAEWPARARKQVSDDVWQEATAEADAVISVHARARAQERREEARTRFQRDLSRLHAYYAGQIAEYQRRRRSELSLLRVEELEEERELRVRELVRATEVRVEVEPLQALAVEVPLQTARLVLRPTDGAAAEAEGPAPGLSVVFDRATGALALPTCPSCAGGLQDATLAACDAGHVVHDRCLDRCRACEAVTCGACVLAPCDVCRRPLCESCGTPCPTCEQRGCAEHLTTCATCGVAGCAACFHPCAHCGAVVCEEHRHPAGGGSEAVLCATCAAPCPGCRIATLTEDLRRCDRCGRKFCATCNPREASACVLCLGGA